MQQPMNLLNIYLRNPGSYIFAADGGFGKTTSMLYLAKRTFGQSINGKRILPVYIRMKEMNNCFIQPEVVFRFIARHYNDEVDTKALLNMIKNSRNEVQYLFLLDGINEIIDYTTDNNQRVLETIFEDVRTLIDYQKKYHNVHVILSTRRVETIPRDIQSEVLILRPAKNKTSRGLSDDVIAKYLGDDLKKVHRSEVLSNQMLRNPMFLIMFKSVYKDNPEKAINIKKKTELFDQYFVLEFNNYIEENGHTDFRVGMRKFVYETVLPYIGFCEAKRLLRKQEEVDSREAVIQDVLDNFSVPDSLTIKSIDKELNTLRLIDENHHFYHDLYRDYFAAKGFDLVLKNAELDAGVKDALELLVQEMKYTDNNWPKDGDKYDLKRRLTHFDFAEFLYGLYDDQLSKALSEHLRMEEIDPVELAESFYQEMAGVYDDIEEGEKASSCGMIAFRLLNSRRSSFKGEDGKLELATKLNYLYYCVNRDEDHIEEAYKCLIEAEEIAGSIDVSKLRKKTKNEYYRTFGKIKSNIGSYFYSRGCAKKEHAKVDLLEANEYHLSSLRFREDADDYEGQIQSLRTLMSDCYQLEEYEQGYDYYKDANNRLHTRYSADRTLPEDFIERAIGCELGVLLKSKDTGLKQEIIENVPDQIEIVFNKCKMHPSRRKKMIDSLKDKVDELIEFAQDSQMNSFLEVLEHYAQELEAISHKEK